VGTLPAEDGAGRVLSFARDEIDELVMIAQWCSGFLNEPPPAGYSEQAETLIHAILERNLSRLQSQLDALRNDGAGDASFG
jgi:hypothetical protein